MRRPVVVTRPGHRRRIRTARRMAALGWPHWRICQALGLSRRRLAAVLACDVATGDVGLVWSDAHRLVFREALR